MNTDDRSNWPSLLNAVQNPLNFFTLVALISSTIFSLSAAITDRIPAWAPFSILVLAIACVFTIVMKNPQAMFSPPESESESESESELQLVISSFKDKKSKEIEMITIYPDHDRCLFQIRDRKNEKHEYPAQVSAGLGPGRWVFHLQGRFESTDTVTLKIFETEQGENREWQVSSFYPNHHSREATLIEEATLIK